MRLARRGRVALRPVRGLVGHLHPDAQAALGGQREQLVPGDRQPHPELLVPRQVRADALAHAHRGVHRRQRNLDVVIGDAAALLLRIRRRLSLRLRRLLGLGLLLGRRRLPGFRGCIRRLGLRLRFGGCLRCVRLRGSGDRFRHLGFLFVSLRRFRIHGLRYVNRLGRRLIALVRRLDDSPVRGDTDLLVRRRLLRRGFRQRGQRQVRAKHHRCADDGKELLQSLTHPQFPLALFPDGTRTDIFVLFWMPQTVTRLETRVFCWTFV